MGKKKFSELELLKYWEAGEEGFNIFKIALKTAVQKYGKNTIKEALEERISLQLLRNVGREGEEFYVIETSRMPRSGLAWLRLGGWKSQSVRIENIRLCPLCGEKDNKWHIIGECDVMMRERERGGS